MGKEHVVQVDIWPSCFCRGRAQLRATSGEERLKGPDTLSLEERRCGGARGSRLQRPDGLRAGKGKQLFSLPQRAGDKAAASNCSKAGLDGILSSHKILETWGGKGPAEVTSSPTPA